MHLSAIIVASGSSRRMGFDKLAAPLAGMPVLRRTVEVFRTCPRVGRVVVVCPAGRFDECGVVEGGAPPVVRVDGGRTRQQSVANGLAAIPPEEMFVAVHDGARPLVTHEIIDECFERAREFGAAAAARRVTETLKSASPDGFSRRTVDRTDLWITETPQTFRTRVLRRAFEELAIQRATVTDEVSAAEMIGISSFLVQSRALNPKITYPWDLAIAEAILKGRDEGD